ncbi:CLUMA_CG019389, isoform A [Clunio marinus]|uniref:CLUMA_CG019389, isoform A n=1 Tax=Clunio marinus TaxID=568069 RepID=A0A1J1J385_9DIPT|nr:CLUMA_CG019389, isoform A [Clunio marinus]
MSTNGIECYHHGISRLRILNFMTFPLSSDPKKGITIATEAKSNLIVPRWKAITRELHYRPH